MLRYLPLLLLLPAVAFAQTPEVAREVADLALAGEKTAQRNEDVEILRRLLNKACGLPDKASVSVSEQAVQSFSNASEHYLGMIGTAQLLPPPKTRTVSVVRSSTTVGPFDGVYLSGAGVVYTLHVPAGVPRTLHGDRIGLNSSCSTCHQSQVHITHTMPVSVSACTTCHSDTPKAPAVLSEWDRTKMDVRGEKPKESVAKPKDDKPSPAMCEPGSLHSLISGVLAANAKNVRHLGEKESLSVVVTFDEVTVAKADTAIATDRSGFTADEVKALTLADLHMKQGKYKEAGDIYTHTLSRFGRKEFKLSGPANMTAEQREQYAEEFQKGVRDAMNNYAKALLLDNKPDQARQMLDLAAGFVVLEATPTTGPAKSTAPAKLIVTVSRADLEAAKDTTAVRKAVKAERVNFPTEAKK